MGSDRMELSHILIVSCALLAVNIFARACDDANCNSSNGTVCNEKGTCDCGICKCEEPYSGPTCEECPTCPSPCEIYKGCVGCKIFGTGELSAMECIIHCDYIASYFPVDQSDFDSAIDDDKILCRTLNEDYCMESFRIGKMTDGYRDLYVRTDVDCDAKYLPTEPTVIEVPLDTDDSSRQDSKTENNSVYKNSNQPEEAGAVAGSNQGQTRDNGSGRLSAECMSTLLVSLFTVLLCFL